jgi:hypothetical protein
VWWVKTENPKWKSKFRQDIRTKLSHSKKEFDLYNTTGSIIYLQQACEKMYNVVENWLMIKYSRRAKSYGHLREIIKNNKYDADLLFDASLLHKFFYNGELQMDTTDAMTKYKSVYERMFNRVD